MFKVDIEVNKKDYIACSIFYIKKYISARELILLGVLLAVALLFWITLENMLIFIMFSIVVLLMAFAVVLFVITAFAGYKSDFVKHGIVRQLLVFYEWGFSIDSINKDNQVVFREQIEFMDIDKVALRKDRIYLYGGVALPFYIFANAVVEGGYDELRIFLIDNINKTKFKMKTKRRAFPYYSKKQFDADLSEKLDRIDRVNQNEDNDSLK